MKVLLLGGTKGIGRALGRQLVEKGHALFLLGRDREDLERSAQDFSLRGGKSVSFALCDLENPATFLPAIHEADAALERFDCVVVTAGMFATQEKLEQSIELTQRLLNVNFVNTVLFCEQVRPLLQKRGGTLCVLSSVAGERGRKPVVLYGASKAGLSAYLEGLDIRFHSEGLKVVCIKPGFVKTGMTEGLKPPPFASEAEPVAADILRAIERGTPVVYTPTIWALVMAVIRSLPRAVMRRLAF